MNPYQIEASQEFADKLNSKDISYNLGPIQESIQQNSNEISLRGDKNVLDKNAATVSRQEA